MTSLEKLHYLRLEDIATLDTAAFREAIATAEGCGVEPAEVEGARKTLKQAETVQEASRKKKEKVARDGLNPSPHLRPHLRAQLDRWLGL